MDAKSQLSRRAIAGALATLTLCTGCSTKSAVPAPTAAVTPAEPAKEQPAEIQLPPLPTHWKAEKPVGTSAGPVTAEMLTAATSSPDRWIQYGGNYRNFRHSPLKNLTPESAKKLAVAWAFPTGTTGQFEASPVVYGGVMYVTSSYNRLFALDATSGKLLWRYDHKNAENLRLCCGPPNRGVGIAGDLVIMGTLDAHLIAFDRKTGEIVWKTEVADYKGGFSLTSAPLVVGELAIIGVAGGEYGVRGFFDAYDVRTGKLAWRHYTIPAKGEPGAETWSGDSYERGGAPAWTTGAYDPETDTLYWTTGNPVARLGRRRPRRRQPVLGLAARARPEDRRAEVVFPVHAARRLGLRRQHADLPGRHQVRRQAAQADRAGEPQRLLLRARPHRRDVPARHALPRAGELGDDRRQGPARA